VNIITRSEWGAAPPKTVPKKIATPSKELWLHHTASPSGGAERVRQIQAFHQGPMRGWNDIAYSFLVNHDGTIFEGRGAGIAGGHTAGHNSISHAICVLGHYDLTFPSPASVTAVVELARHGHDQGWWPDQFTGGHRDASGANTSCPGKHLHAKLPEINRLILEDDMPTPEEIAKAVWDHKIWDSPTNVTASIALSRTNRNARATVLGLDNPDEAAIAANIVDALSDSLAAEVADVLAARLAQ